MSSGPGEGKTGIGGVEGEEVEVPTVVEMRPPIEVRWGRAIMGGAWKLPQ